MDDPCAGCDHEPFDNVSPDPEPVPSQRPAEVLACEQCGKTDETVFYGPCGYFLDVHNAAPEECMETVCGDCEREHCNDI